MSKGIAGVISEVRRSGEELCIDWRIPRFLDLSGEGFNYYNSPRFSFSGALWHLELFPNWESSGLVSLFLWRDEDQGTTSARTLDVSVGMRGSGGGVRWRIVRKWEIKNDAGLWLGVLCPRLKVSEWEHRLLPRNVLTITCEVKVPGTTAREVTNDDEDEISEGQLLSYECSEDVSNEDEADGSASKERKTSEEENAKKRQQSSDECDICCEAPVDCALNPCGHMCWCYNCALRFWEEDAPRCPMCRKSIHSILKTYRK